MAYWTYENWVAENKAVIHRSDCRFCNDGGGTGRNVLGERNGRWRGPYETLDEVESAARGTGRPVRNCRCIRLKGGWSPILKGSSLSDQCVPTVQQSHLFLARDLEDIGFIHVGKWHLYDHSKAGVRFSLNSLQRERVIYAFVLDHNIMYLGICDSSSTTLTDRMNRYQNMVGGGTNERIIGLIRTALAEGANAHIYALRPGSIPAYGGIDIDCVKGMENPLIRRFKPPWNKRQ